MFSSMNVKDKEASQSKHNLGRYLEPRILNKDIQQLIDVVLRRYLIIICVQETKSAGQKVREVENTGFKLWYLGLVGNRNAICILASRQENQVCTSGC